MDIIYILYILTIIIVFYNYNIEHEHYNRDNFKLLNGGSCNFLKNTLFGITDKPTNISVDKPDSSSKSLYIHNSYDLVSDVEKDIESDTIYYWAFSCISQDMYINTVELNISKLIIPNVNIQIGLYTRNTSNINDSNEFNIIKIINDKYMLSTTGYISLSFDTIYLPHPKEGSCYYLGLKIIDTNNNYIIPFKLWCKSLNVNMSNNPCISLFRKCDNKTSLTDIGSLCKGTIIKTTWIPYIQVYHN